MTDLHKDITAIKEIADMTPRMVGLMKLVVAMLVAASLAISSVGFWVKVTTDRLHRLEVAAAQLETERKASVADWQSWRSAKDANDVKVTIILENMQKMIERTQSLHDDQRRLDILRR